MSKIVDITGNIYGKLKVRMLSQQRRHGKTAWVCDCECGNDVVVTGTALKTGNTRSCGCLPRSQTKQIPDYIGRKFNNLTVVSYDKDKSLIKKQRFWMCRCDCGNSDLISVSGHKLTHNKVTRCYDCARKAATENRKTHGMKYTRMYSVWGGIKERCLNENAPDYYRYGGRGIKICKEWEEDFVSFYDWAMKNEYSDNLTIDRIDVDGNYEPDNCRWATLKEQARNKRDTIYIEVNGEDWVLLDYLESIGRIEEYDKIRSRISRNWSLEESFNIPFNLKRHCYYFGEFLIEEFKGKDAGHEITKADFISKYGDRLPHHKVASYMNNKYIKELVKQYGIKNLKHKFIKMEE